MAKSTPGIRLRQRRLAQKRLVAALLVICRNMRRMQTAPAARAACDDVIRWLLVLTAVRTAKRRSGKGG